MTIKEYFTNEISKDYEQDELEQLDLKEVLDMIKYIELSERVEMYKKVQNLAEGVLQTVSSMSMEDIKKMRGW